MARLSALVRGNLTAGDHTVLVTGVEETASKDGNPQLMFKVKSDNGESGRWWKSLLPQAQWSLIRDFVNAGIDADIPDDDDGAKVRALTRIAHDLEGRKLRVGVSYDDSERIQVRIQGTADGGTSGDVSRL